MSQVNTVAAVVGATGLVGSNILSTLLGLASQPVVHAIARRNFENTASNLKAYIEPDSAKWADAFSSFSPPPSLFLSALGTTRGQAGSFEAQRKIDYDLNLALAKAAKDSGIKVYVLISSAGTSKTSPFPYGKMKVELEEAVEALGFAHTVILRPGFLLGSREKSKSPFESLAVNIAKGLSAVSKGYATDGWAQDASVVAKAAVAAGMQCVAGERPASVWRLNQADIVKLGRTEWKMEK